MKKSILFLISIFSYSLAFTQFAPGANQPGTTAIFKDDAAISFWADSIIEVKRGWLDIADTTLGKASFGTIENGLGYADGTLYSFGDNGEVILYFSEGIINYEGFDFAIFENTFPAGGLNEYFTELAFVEVSYDGINYNRFDAISNVPTNTQVGSFESINCTNINNLAGKYQANYGTPFDLDEIGLDSIKYIKLIDVVGSINPNFASYDSDGNIINDPYPTAFESGGFDLDAVAVINQFGEATSIKQTAVNSLSIFPNPVFNGNSITIEFEANFEVVIYDLLGKKIIDGIGKNIMVIPTQSFKNGNYFLVVKSEQAYHYEKISVR